MKNNRIIALILFVFFLFSCSNKEPLVIGLVADFGDRTTSFGTHCRNGAQLAVDDINREGGIDGREVILLARNNKNDPENMKSIINEFHQRGVNFVVGPHISRIAPSFLKEIEGKNILAISPSVSSNEFAQLDDNFFRIQPSASSDGALIGQAVVDSPAKTVALVRSQINGVYTDWFMKGARDIIETNSITVVYDHFYKDQKQLIEVVEELLEIEPDAIVFSSPGSEAAKIIQLYGKSKTIPQLFGDEWSKNTGLLQYGGRTIEGMINAGMCLCESSANRQRKFVEEYTKIYSLEPIIYSYFAYDAVLLLKRAIEEEGKEGTIASIKKRLIDMEDFMGISGPLNFDPFGDSLKTKSLYIVREGSYVLY